MPNYQFYFRFLNQIEPAHYVPPWEREINKKHYLELRVIFNEEKEPIDVEMRKLPLMKKKDENQLYGMGMHDHYVKYDWPYGTIIYKIIEEVEINEEAEKDDIPILETEWLNYEDEDEQDNIPDETLWTYGNSDD